MRTTSARRTLAAGTLSAILGLGIGWIDIHTTEVAATILPLLISGGLLGIWHPVGAWRWALLLTAGIPIVGAVGVILRLPTAEPIRFDPLVYCVVFLFALAGCYSGAIVRRFIGPKND